MSDLQATVAETKNGFHVEGYEKIEYDFTFIDNVFSPEKDNLAKCYEKWGRVLAVMDQNIFDVYGDQIQAYFDHYKLDLKIHKTMIGEKAKTMPTLLSIVDSMTEFGIYRKVRESQWRCVRPRSVIGPLHRPQCRDCVHWSRRLTRR